MEPQLRFLNLYRGPVPVPPDQQKPEPTPNQSGAAFHYILVGLVGLVAIAIIIARCWCGIRHKLGRSNSTQDSHATTTSASSRSSLFKSIIPGPIRTRIWPPPNATAGNPNHARSRHNPANSIDTLPPYPGPDGPPNYNQIIRHPHLYIMLHLPLFITMRRHQHSAIDVHVTNPPPTVTLHFVPPIHNNIPAEPPPIYYYTGIQSAHHPALRAPSPRASAGPVEQHLLRTNNY